ncbi:uncharacterized protein OCT59_017034 [Rhizophagus irregularis]|uniref:Uncharacterized protein n=2 Tax=Rhizophagus irregularis TaxID=588596 RepID=U9TBE6_RHIID|nr:hypothetical protein GLOIN_2v1588737 [Rhizophagus irregularis DAOM 181602=DAOM 197198]EXX66564.1 hypothetical protein RirG_122650 [Rhizophagus irregularis DAOM 197198w]UZO24740.1 hypothetical protein OCT59_017034 [Rhizophagus irregularis]POG73176.1 hypothetical protein GLOIN_2v1588737 [Rhizophagus irregularis DAOM 181602=DAOM 197198]CAG8539047.1 22724_t:CDS:1 [Rhizophagus irregularis]GBC14686.1 hypothetical protein GLOIN_2v1588737 [Rhizophagus irregularis DAOM 181602=DAOM 197198]|eukprot:XP_025180042.1 hypothetical protein GLOIN_2v1588737 [Rhizophagus irregularis DAOM 181602=DAOM 197198]
MDAMGAVTIDPAASIRPVTQSNTLIQQTNKQTFFHYTPEDDCFYLVTCKNILQEPFLDNHVYDHGFFFSNSVAKYYVTCKYIPHSLIISLLNKELCRMDHGAINLNRKESLFLSQKFNLEQDLKQILPSHLIEHNIPERKDDINFHVNNIPTTRTTVQTNFDNNLSFNDNYFANQRVNAVGGYTHVIDSHFNNSIPQQILERDTRPDYNGNINSFHDNIAMTTQTDSITNDQTNFNSSHHQNGVESFQIPDDDHQDVDYTHNSQQQVDLANFPQYHILESKENIENYVTSVVPMADTNQNYIDNDLPRNDRNDHNYRQNVYTHQQVELSDFPSQHIPETKLDFDNAFDGNIGNDLTITQAVPD